MLALAAALLLAAIASPARAGVGELNLDRAAVAELLAAALPGSVEVELPGGASVTVELGRPRGVDFAGGAVLSVVPVSIPDLGLQADLRLRYVPRIDPLYGVASLVADEARIAGVPADIAAFLPVAALPRRADWRLDLGDGRALDVVCHVQGVRVGDERLELELGLTTRSAGSR